MEVDSSSYLKQIVDLLLSSIVLHFAADRTVKGIVDPSASFLVVPVEAFDITAISVDPPLEAVLAATAELPFCNASLS